MRKVSGYLCRMFFVTGLMSLLTMVSKSGLTYEGHILPPTIPGDYEGKWYGIYIPNVPRENFPGLRPGPAFPNQVIINSWGYKAKPIDEIKELIPELYYDICSHPELWGEMRINETAFIPREQWPCEFTKIMDEATKRNKGTARLNERGHLVNYKNGVPFPGSTDGKEIAWNIIYNLINGQQMIIPFYTAITDRKGNKRYCMAEQNYYWVKGRLFGEHVPEYTPNPNNYQWFQTMGFTFPYDLKGLIILTMRYDDPEKEDDQWMYIPSLRRIRRMSSAQRWDKLPGGQDQTYDSAIGFQGKPTNYEWKYLGRKILLCGRSALDQNQELKDKPGGGGADQVYQRVNSVMVEYIPKIISSVSRAVVYLDPESYCCYYLECYDRKGRPYLFDCFNWAITGDGCMLPMGFLVTDVQRIHSSNNYMISNFFNLDAEENGIKPAYFSMENLRRIFSGR